MSWVLNAYAIVFAALLVPAGRLADRIGRKRAFLGGLALFVLGSALCGVAPLGRGAHRRARDPGRGRRAADPDLAGAAAARVRAGRARRRRSASGPRSAASPRPPGPPIGGLLVEVELAAGVPRQRPGRARRGRSSARASCARAATPTATAARPARRRPARRGDRRAGARRSSRRPDWGWADARRRSARSPLAAVACVAFWRALPRATRRRSSSPTTAARALLRARERRVAAVLRRRSRAMLLAGVLFMTGVWRFSVLKAGLCAGARGPRWRRRSRRSRAGCRCASRRARSPPRAWACSRAARVVGCGASARRPPTRARCSPACC